MQRSHSTPSSQYFNDHVADIMDSVDQDSRFNASFQTTTSNASASSSKAVLAALRALQDKIRRLEQERSQALDDATQLRHQLQSQEVEFENAKKRESLISTKTVQETRHELDRIISEKTELEIRMAKLEEKNRESRDHADDLKKRIILLEEEKYQVSMKLKEFETDQHQLEHQIELQQRKESDLAQSMAREARRHEEDISTMNHRMQLLQTDLADACKEKAEADARLVELDELVGQLLQLNEALVAKLSGKPMKKSFQLGRLGSVSVASALGGSKKKSAKKSVNVPRAASVTTAATEAGKVQKYEIMKHLQTVHVDPADLDHLQMMHNMYRGLAKTILGKPKTGGKKKTTVSTGESGRQPTRMSRKKHKLLASTGNTHASSTGFERTSLNLDESEDEYGHHRDLSSSRLSTSSSARKARSLSPNRTFAYSARGISSPKSALGSTSQHDLQAVINSLEEEFDELNGSYRKLLSTSQRDSDSSAANGDGAGPAHADELIHVIQQLHKKGEQLRALKHSAATSAI